MTISGLTNTSFIDCENGIWLLNCDNYNLFDCYFNGKGVGTGIRATESTGDLKSNTIQNHSSGIVAVSCSPLIVENNIHDNATCGIALIGYNTFPQLVDPSSTNAVLNNNIVNNGLTTAGENGCQIYIRYKASAYLSDGYNNIYSGNDGEVPEVPCIKAVSDMTVNQQKSLTPDMRRILISAEDNYWGADPDLTDYTNFFDLWKSADGLEGYGIDYNPYAIEPYVADNPQPPFYNEPPSQEEQLLKVAMKLEDNGNYKPAIKKYETLIEKYPDSPEYYIASTRLPQALAKQEASLDPLIRTYDDALASEEVTNKKFFKQMKVSTNIKSKKYDEAIVLAEELKAEAETEMEEELCYIDIAICNMMINAQNKNSNRSSDISEIDMLIDSLIGDDKSEPSDITESVLPTAHTLYQNYPNPFNPTTEIKYSLSQDAKVQIVVYNTNGEQVANLVNATQNSGMHTVSFDAGKLSNGVFYYTLVANNSVVDTKKMILIK